MHSEITEGEERNKKMEVEKQLINAHRVVSLYLKLQKEIHEFTGIKSRKFGRFYSMNSTVGWQFSYKCCW